MTKLPPDNRACGMKGGRMACQLMTSTIQFCTKTPCHLADMLARAEARADERLAIKSYKPPINKTLNHDEAIEAFESIREMTEEEYADIYVEHYEWDEKEER